MPNDRPALEIVISREARKSIVRAEFARLKIFQTIFKVVPSRIALEFVVAAALLTLLAGTTDFLRSPALGVFAILALGIGIVSIIYWVLRFHLLGRRYLGSRSSSDWRLTLSPAGINISYDQQEAQIDWSRIRDVELTNQAIFLVMDDRERWLTIPRVSFLDDDACKIFLQRLEEYRSRSLSEAIISVTP